MTGRKGLFLILGLRHAAAEFRGIDGHQLAEIGGIDALHLGRRDHQVIKNGIVKNGLPVPVIDDTTAGVDAFAEKSVFLRLLFVFFGDDLQVEKLCRDDQEHACENEADDIAARLIEYRHMDLLLQGTD